MKKIVALVIASLCCTMAAFAQTATISSSSPLPVTVVGSGSAAQGAGVTVGSTAVTLFGGATPAHGFQVFVQGTGETVWLNDTGTASSALGGSSIAIGGGTNNGYMYTTPSGYVPGGPVSVVSPSGTSYISARSW